MYMVYLLNWENNYLRSSSCWVPGIELEAEFGKENKSFILKLSSMYFVWLTWNKT